MSSTPRLGVGIIGAGAVSQAIHLPTLAALDDRFRVARILDPNAALAAEVAARTDSAWTTELDELLADPAVDVVAINSPQQHHADQIEAVCAAGVRGILCEKPLATSHREAERIGQACSRAQIPLVVGAMHTWDPAWRAAIQAWDELDDRGRLVRSIIYLPDNATMIDLATELAPMPAPGPSPEEGAGDARVAALVSGVLGLAIHNTPLVRQFMPNVDVVTTARAIAPWGYAISMNGGGCAAQMIGLLPGSWRPDWTFDVWGESLELHIEFPPSYVAAGSARATLASADHSRSWAFPTNGYHHEWQHLSDVVNGDTTLAISLADVLDDLVFALDLAEAATDALLAEAAA